MTLPLADLESLRLLLPGFATYLVHSTVCALLALLVVPRLRRAATRDGLWKLALVAPLATTGLALVLPGGAGWLALEAPGARPTLDGGTVAGEAGRSGPLLSLPAGVVPPAKATAPARGDAPARGAADAAHPAPAPPIDPWGLGVGALLAASALALGRLAWRRRRLTRLLAERRCVRDPRLRDALPDAAGLRWSEHPALPGPVALGRREVCLPRDAWRDLGDAELRAVLGHERAHLERRDPLVLGLVDALVAATVWQPLNRRLRARLVRDVELACDARAVRATGDPLGLARVLERFARRLGDPAPAAAALPGLASMAPSPSALVQRVEHLLTGEHGPERRRTRAVALLGAGLVLGALACQGPAVRGEEADGVGADGDPLVARVEEDEAGPDAVGADDFFLGRGEVDGGRSGSARADRGDAPEIADAVEEHPDAGIEDDFFVGRGAVEGGVVEDEVEGENVEFTDVTEEEAPDQGFPVGSVLLFLDPDGHVEHMPWVPGQTLTEYADGMLAVLVERLDESNAADPDLRSERIGGMVLRPNRVVLSLDPDMPFVHALRWMERMAQPKVGLHRISLRVTGTEAEPVAVDLPTDLHDLEVPEEVPMEEPEDGESVLETPVSGGRAVLVLRGDHFTFDGSGGVVFGPFPAQEGETDFRFRYDEEDWDDRLHFSDTVRSRRIQVEGAAGRDAETAVRVLRWVHHVFRPDGFSFVAPLPEPTPEGR